MFGTSNLVNNNENNDTANALSQDLGAEVSIIPTYRFDQLKEKIKNVNFKKVQVIFMLILGNEAKYIAYHLKHKSDKYRTDLLNSFVQDTAYLIDQIPKTITVIFCDLLIRFDKNHETGMSNPNFVRKMMNSQLKGHSKHFT